MNLRALADTLALVLALVLALAPAFMPGTAAAAEPQHIVVAYPAGGPVDAVVRQMNPALQGAVNRPVVIDNVPGAAGGLGVQKLLAAAPPLSPWLVGTPSETILAPLLNPALRYQPEQLRLVGFVTHVPVALVGGPHLAARTLPELVATARARADLPMAAGNYGVGSHGHLVAEDFSTRADVALLHVPYAGVAALVRDLVGERVDLAFLPLNGAVQDLVAQGRLHLYAMASARRNAHVATTPTVDEALGTGGFEHDLWVGLFVSRTSSDSAVTQAHAALGVALADPAFRRLKAAEGIVVADPLPNAEAQARYERQVVKYRAIAARVHGR